MITNTKQNNTRVIKLLGIEIYKSIREPNTRIQHILGIIKTRRTKYDNKMLKRIYIFGIMMHHKYNDGVISRLYICGHMYRKCLIKDMFYNRYKKYFDKKYDSFYVLSAHGGETYLFLRYFFKNFIAKNNSQRPLLIATKRYHMELANMLCPHIEKVYIKSMSLDTKDEFFVYRDQAFYKIFSSRYFGDVERAIKSSGEHYFNMMSKYLDVEMSHDIDILPNAKNIESMSSKIKDIGLNVDKFVILMPEALSCDELKTEFWLDIADALMSDGYDIFVNLTQTNKSFDKYKSVYLSMSEIVALSKYAKTIIGLRSGLSEILLHPNVPMVAIYNEFRNRSFFGAMDTKDVMSGYALSKLPNVNSKLLYEYNSLELSNSKIISQIINNIKNNA